MSNYSDSVKLVFPLIYQYLLTSSLQGKFFIVSWIILLNDVEPCESVIYFPEWLDGILNIYTESNTLLQNDIKKLLDLYLRSIADYHEKVDVSKIFDVLYLHVNSDRNSIFVLVIQVKLVSFDWILAFLELFKCQITPFIPIIYGVIYKHLVSPYPVSERCTRINAKLKTLACLADSQPFDFFLFADILKKSLRVKNNQVILSALDWYSILVDKFTRQIWPHVDHFFDSILDLLQQDSNVVKSSIFVLTTIANQIDVPKNYLTPFLKGIVETFLADDDLSLLKSQGPFIVENILNNLDGVKFFTEISKIIIETAKKDVIGLVVYHLNVMLLTMDQTSGFRTHLITSDKVRLAVTDRIGKCFRQCLKVGPIILHQLFPFAFYAVNIISHTK
ncbi:Protein VAC14 [Thelohanellus kitauei]|uniref:Protein VAC14 homolog n=1 Tax=Thelohanellus kitauei TaxID=669202 RepID=A0A0C2IWN3_THEKT|nr:Protein VAC14 [Thelohanellus kitauei]